MLSLPVRRARRAGIPAAVAAFALCAAPAARAQPPRPWVPVGLDQTVSSDHVTIHYGTAIDAATATGLDAAAEHALAAYAALGFPPPKDDGDGHVDIYVYPVTSPFGDVLGLTRPDAVAGDTASGAIAVRPEAAGDAQVVAHEIFHLVQYAFGWRLPRWMKETTAEWAAYNVAGPAQRLGYFLTPRPPLDCEAATESGGCDGDGGGYRRWLFFEALSERYGPGVVRDVLAQSAAMAAGDHVTHGLDAVQAALTTRGSDLATALADLGWRMAAGTFTLDGLTGRSAWIDATVATGAAAAPVSGRSVAIDHAGIAFVAVRGTTATCAPATLHITILAPAGEEFRALFTSRGRPPMALSLHGPQATGDFPWTTCTRAQGVIALANTGPLDGQVLLVNVTVTALAGGSTPATTIAPSGVQGEAPVLSGLHVRRRRHGESVTVRMIVRSSGPGRLRALIADRRGNFTLAVRRVPIRRGLNSLTLRVPARGRAKHAVLRLQSFLAPTADNPTAYLWGATISLPLTLSR